MKKNKNYLFILGNKYLPHKCYLSSSDDLYLIVPKSNFNYTELEELKYFYKEVILVEQYSNSGEVEIKAKELHERHHLDRIIAFAEEDVLRAARLRDWLHLPGQSYESAVAFRDKIIMKEYLKKSGFKLPVFASARSAVDVQEFYEKNGFPFIVKPVRGTHAQNTYLIKNKKELYDFVVQPGNFDVLHSSHFDVEKFIDGTMYQIDGVIRDGHILAVWPARYVNTSLSMLKGKVFGSHLLSSENPLTDRLNEYAKKVLQALPVPQDMVFHLEVFHTPEDEIIFCEIASRIGGGPTRNFWLQSFGVDLAEEFLKSQLGEAPGETLIRFSKKTNEIPGIIIHPPQEGKTIKHIEKNCNFPWVEKYEVSNYKEGERMLKIKGLDDFMALISLNAPNDTIFLERFNEFNEWFNTSTVFND